MVFRDKTISQFGEMCRMLNIHVMKTEIFLKATLRWNCLIKLFKDNDKLNLIN